MNFNKRVILVEESMSEAEYIEKIRRLEMTVEEQNKLIRKAYCDWVALVAFLTAVMLSYYIFFGVIVSLS
jgi:hypothetical protein|nr:MAG TPA: hypothetical protein [Caudoviricetes sp.]DAV37719.1 MAG TPA: hypothetical protein [Bacteriophage sp.]